MRVQDRVQYFNRVHAEFQVVLIRFRRSLKSIYFLRDRVQRIFFRVKLEFGKKKKRAERVRSPVSNSLSDLNRKLYQDRTCMLNIPAGFGFFKIRMFFLRPRSKSAKVLPRTRRCCDVSSELCCPGAKSRRWSQPLVTRFGVMQRAE